MKAPAFAYARPRSLEDAYALLDEHRDRAKILAGGQSLMPALNMRLSSPRLLVDINALTELDGIARHGDALRIGAMTRHRSVEQSAEVARALPLLAAAMPHIAHVAIRNRGTIGGSIAFADPAAEIAAVALALDATIVIGSARGERRVSARQFFIALFETALAPDELILAVEFPLAAGYRSAFCELARRHGDYAVVGLALHARVEGQRLDDVRLAFLGAGATARLAMRAARALTGQSCDADSIDSAVAALAADLDPLPDLYHARETKLHLAGVLLRRAIGRLLH
jgi:aerobic carbon-monoxide dehydrogenase medium subunit